MCVCVFEDLSVHASERKRQSILQANYVTGRLSSTIFFQNRFVGCAVTSVHGVL